MGIRDDLFRAMKNGEVTLVLADLFEGFIAFLSLFLFLFFFTRKVSKVKLSPDRKIMQLLTFDKLFPIPFKYKYSTVIPIFLITLPIFTDDLHIGCTCMYDSRPRTED